MIVSFNGLDGSGKTTQIENIHKLYYKNEVLVDSIIFPKEIANYSEKEFHDWWFITSTPEIFTDTLYKAIKKRCNTLKNKRKIYLLDKGLSNFDARVYATLRIKGLSEYDATSFIKKYKTKYNLIDNEDIKILFINNDKNNKKVYDSTYDNSQIELYKKYRTYQEEFIEGLRKNNYYTFIYEINESINSLTKKIYNDIENFNKKAKFNNKVITIDELNIPDKEKTIITEIKNYTLDLLQNNLTGFLIHGSISRNAYIKSFSDIDILIFVNIYDSVNFKKIDQFIKKYDIKIGITVFSSHELKKYMVDAKSFYSIYSYNSKKITSLIYANNLWLPSLSINDLKRKNIQVIPETIHKLKRILYSEISDNNFKEIYKLLTLVMKVDLINNHNIFSQSYYQTFYNFSYIYNIEEIDVDNLIFKKDPKELFDYGLKVLDIISNGGALNE